MDIMQPLFSLWAQGHDNETHIPYKKFGVSPGTFYQTHMTI